MGKGFGGMFGGGKGTAVPAKAVIKGKKTKAPRKV